MTLSGGKIPRSPFLLCTPGRKKSIDSWRLFPTPNSLLWLVPWIAFTNTLIRFSSLPCIYLRLPTYASQEYTSVNAKNLGKEFLRVGICTKHINNFSRMLPDTKAAEDPQAGMFTKNGRLPYRAKFSDWMAARRSQKTQTSFQIDFVVAVSCNFIVSLSVIPIEKIALSCSECGISFTYLLIVFEVTTAPFQYLENRNQKKPGLEMALSLCYNQCVI